MCFAEASTTLRTVMPRMSCGSRGTDAPHAATQAGAEVCRWAIVGVESHRLLRSTSSLMPKSPSCIQQQQYIYISLALSFHYIVWAQLLTPREARCVPLQHLHATPLGALCCRLLRWRIARSREEARGGTVGRRWVWLCSGEG